MKPKSISTKAQKAHTKFGIRNSRCEIRNTKFVIRNSKYDKHQPSSQSEPVLHRHCSRHVTWAPPRERIVLAGIRCGWLVGYDHGGIRYGALRSRRSHSIRRLVAAGGHAVDGADPIYHCDVYRFSRIRHAFASMAAVNEIKHCDVTSFRLKIA